MERRRGAILIEVLVAGAILAVCLMALVSLFTFSFNLTFRHERTSAAYNLARRIVEHVKETGFDYTSEGSSVRYYDVAGLNPHTSTFTGAMYSATTVVTSDKMETNPVTGQTRPAQDSLRTVVVTVTNLQTNEVEMKTGTFLVRSGV